MNIQKIAEKDFIENYSSGDLKLLFKHYNVNSVSNLVSAIYKTGTMNGQFAAAARARLLQENIINSDYFKNKDNGGYQFIIDHQPPRSRHPLANGTLKELLYTRANIHEMLNPAIPANFFEPIFQPYWINTLRRNRGVTVANTLAAVEPIINENFAGQYKIHLQPRDEYLIDTLLRVWKIIGVPGYPIINFKFAWDDPSDLMQRQTDIPPTIVIYPNIGSARKVLNDILRATNDVADKWGSGITPRGNINVNNLVYYAGGDWDLKKTNPELFNPEKTLFNGQQKII